MQKITLYKNPHRGRTEQFLIEFTNRTDNEQSLCIRNEIRQLKRKAQANGGKLS